VCALVVNEPLPQIVDLSLNKRSSGPESSLSQFFSQIFRLRVIVTKQHPRIPMARDLGQLMELEPFR
jgi:hypothetical protein